MISFLKKTHLKGQTHLLLSLVRRAFLTLGASGRSGTLLPLGSETETLGNARFK